VNRAILSGGTRYGRGEHLGIEASQRADVCSGSIATDWPGLVRSVLPPTADLASARGMRQRWAKTGSGRLIRSPRRPPPEG
jgi:hypothetical protein